MGTTMNPMLATVLESPDPSDQVFQAKQPPLTDHSREVRLAFNQLPNDVTHALMRDYQPPSPIVMEGMEAAIAAKELAIENATQGQDLDKDWAGREGNGRALNEQELSATDDWNSTPE